MTRKEYLSAAAKIGPVVIRDSIGLAGLVLLVHGVGLIYRPAGWIVAGVLLVAYAALSARGRK